ncbi:hypothetical protein ACN47E_000052 [Coniothyrium glycines]
MATTAPLFASSKAASSTRLPSLDTSLSISVSISSMTAIPTEPPIDLFPVGTPQSSDHERDEAAFNYYFLFLGAFGAAICVILWWLHRRRRKRKEQVRLNGQHALARDMEGWAGTRRLLHGLQHGGTFVRREEGLDERGEAPPPYQPKSETTVVVESANPGVTIPLRTLSRDAGEGTRPPEYAPTWRGLQTASVTPRSAGP